MKQLIFALATIPGSILAHEIPGWEIVNERGPVLVTTVSTTSIAGDWCGVEPAKLTLRCDDAQLSLLIKNRCEPEAGPGGTTSVTIWYSEDYLMAGTYDFEVWEDGRTLELSKPFQRGKLSFNSFVITSLNVVNGGDGTLTASLLQADRPNRDMIFSIDGFEDVLKVSGMQCSVQSLLH